MNGRDSPHAVHEVPDLATDTSEPSRVPEPAETVVAQEQDEAQAAELADLWRKVKEQREAIARSDRARAELRATVEGLQKKIATLTGEREHLQSGAAMHVSTARREELEARLKSVQKEIFELKDSLLIREEELNDLRSSAATASDSVEAASKELSNEEAELSRLRALLEDAEEAESSALIRLDGMVDVADVQRAEAESRRYRELLTSVDKEARQLRLALAEALQSGADLPTAMKEIEVLRESAESAAQRVKALELTNAQLEGRLAQVVADIARLKKGTVDLRSEEDLMREVIFSQSEKLLRKVEDLTDEEKIADEDRRQLLATTADLMAKVDAAETRIARHTELEEECKRLNSAQKTLGVEVERLRRSNDALIHQVLGEDSEGPLAGVLTKSLMFESDDDRNLRDEVNRLVRGQLLISTQGGIKADAAALALQLQQLLAEREEAFWVERQRLSDHLIGLERTRSSRTNSLLRHYDATARSGGSASSSTTPAAAAAAAVTGGLRRLRDAVRV